MEYTLSDTLRERKRKNKRHIKPTAKRSTALCAPTDDSIDSFTKKEERTVPKHEPYCSVHLSQRIPPYKLFH